jgi:S-(hydroxymethyl)glutathione dehydrogenase/alcohol dehydrogenase
MRIPKKIKAAILVEQRKPLIVDEIQPPDALDIGQVLVKIHFSGICGSQLGEINGAKGPDAYLPHLLGHEASAEVLEIGPGVKYVKPGDLVVMHWRKGIGIECAPPKYLWRGSELNAGWITTFNDYAVVSENRLTSIPNNSDKEIAALFGCAITTGFGVAENNAHIKMGESVVIFGAGGVGLSIIQAASLMSAYPIIAVDLFDNRLDIAKKMGATHLINSKNRNAENEINVILKSQGADCFIDNTGVPKIIEMGYKITKPQGRLVLVGVPRKGNEISIYSLPLHFGKIICGSHGGESIPNIDIHRYYKLLDHYKTNLSDLVTEYYSLDDINLAIERMVNGEMAGRCLIKM